MNNFEGIKEIWVTDFEFSTDENLRPKVICFVAHEILSGQVIKLSGDSLNEEPSFLNNPNTLYVAFYAAAEMGCHLELGWQLPNKLIDLYVEFRAITNGKKLVLGESLIGALGYFGLPTIGADEKSKMRELAMRGSPFTASEMESLVDYCESDVIATSSLWKVIQSKMACAEHSLYRGEYIKCLAKMERNGIPVDKNFFLDFSDQFDSIKLSLIKKIDEKYHVYEGSTFKANFFENYLANSQIAWPRLDSGKLALDDDTFKSMARIHPELNELRELKSTLSRTKLNKIKIGFDGRNRVMLSPFKSKTSRNQPSNSSFIFGPSTWIRFGIKPSEGMGLAYIDWSQQEFGIAGALSNDKNMMESYLSGDPYLSFAKLAGALPQEATKKSHPDIREQYKACVLAVQYGMEADSLGLRIDQPKIYAKDLLNKHKDVFSTFWKWSDDCLTFAYLKNFLPTVFGWEYKLSDNLNPRSLRNFPMQANGAEILRLAIILCFEKGIKVCAPIHDAILIEASTDEIENHVQIAQQCMEEASSLVLNGFKLRSEAEIYKFPERYYDKRGIQMWETINNLMKMSR